MRLIPLLVVFSLSGCAAISRPAVDVGIVNAPAKHVKAYNLKNDYDADGHIIPGHAPTFYPAEKIEDLNKWLCVSMRDDKGVAQPEQAQALLKSYIKLLREEFEKGCKN